MRRYYLYTYYICTSTYAAKRIDHTFRNLGQMEYLSKFRLMQKEVSDPKARRRKKTGKIICTIKGGVEKTMHYFYEGETVRDFIVNWYWSLDDFPHGRVYTLDGIDLPLDHKLQLDQTYIFPMETLLVSRDLISVTLILVVPQY